MPSESDPSALPGDEKTVPLPTAAPEVPEAGPAGTGYRVRIPAFEGPLDLLLHLIRVNQIDLFDIPVIAITRQYNETLDLMHELNLEVAGEYLVMAATLLHIKSRMLLPPDPVTASTPEDPRSELVRQLEEYERYRRAALLLSEAEQEHSRSWIRPSSLVSEFEGEASVVVDLFGLLTAFKRILDTLDAREQRALKRDRISLLDRIQWLLDRLRSARRMRFSDLFEGTTTRSELIVTFLALLELIRLQVIGAVQSVRFGEIEVVVLEEGDTVSIDPRSILDV